jgi:hypothetical protein
MSVQAPPLLLQQTDTILDHHWGSAHRFVKQILHLIRNFRVIVNEKDEVTHVEARVTEKHEQLWKIHRQPPNDDATELC